jgi:hypothetical protein
MIAGQAAVKAWINARADLVGPGNRLPNGAHLKELRSPADGAYALVERQAATGTLAFAEDSPFTTVRTVLSCYAGTHDAAELAAAALLAAIQECQGNLVPVTDPEGTAVLRVTDKYVGPVFKPAAGAEETYCFWVGADFIFSDFSD